MLRSVLASLVIGLATLGLSEAGHTTKHSTILIHNDGNWTAHADRPSSILFYEPVSFDEAKKICRFHGESLIREHDLATFKYPLRYQAFLGRISPYQEFWTEESSGSGWEWQLRPFICTNTAPLVDRVAFPFYSLPHANVTVNGTVYQGVRDKFAYRFLGFPHTLQPVGERRFTYPTLWYSNETDVVLNATTYGPDCPAAVGSTYYNNATGLNPWGNSEACVLMNIFTPYLPGEEFPEDDTQLKPVLFWIHGGGTSNQDPTYDGGPLTARSDVVLVSVNWRLDSFGTLSFGDGFVDGNYGNADIIAGLEWVQKHIRAFGGNPQNVTIFGQSAGGESVIEVIRAPLAKGLFSGAIGMSAAVSPATTQEAVANLTVPLVAQWCGNATGAARLECLRGLSTETILNNFTWSVGYGYDSMNYELAPIIDGKYIVNSSVAAAKAGQLNRVNFMIGNMPEEGQLLLGTTISPNATDWNATLYAIDNNNYLPPQWPAMVMESGLWTNGSNPINPYNNTINAYTTVHLTCPAQQFVNAAFEYESFDSIWYYSNHRGYVPPWTDPWGLGTFPVGKPDTPYYRTHSGDLFEVFGTYYIFDQPVRVPEDIGQTNLQQDMWGSFVRTGNPNPNLDYLRIRGYDGSLAVFEHFRWPEFDGNATMNIDYPTPYLSDMPWPEKCQEVARLYHLP